jgi:hypothetical protein
MAFPLTAESPPSNVRFDAHGLYAKIEVLRREASNEPAQRYHERRHSG